jgi:hypothetical protein
MAAKKKAAKAGAAAWAVKDSPAVQRLIQDEELRQTIRDAYDSGRSAYGRLSDGKAPHKAVFDDKKLQKDLRNAAEAIKDAADALREGPKKPKRGGLGKLLLLVIVGAIVALVVSEDLRKKALDALFGAEEEFEYTSPTAAPAPAPTESAPSTS